MSEAKTKGNFSFPGLLIIFNLLNAFRHAESLNLQHFQRLYDTIYLAI
ncbi:hypothetical protein K030_3911 [Acinetobacter baumannii 45057_4]|uniref:Uncharacterized protein n=1 Tax=Acinetobacter baumannii TaxID=470 RepID=A0A6G6AQJ4_ACIBA|nr:hypothetical protein J668_3875 [Acinetobacter baumannii 1276470-86]EYR88846.1 hypothetical protein K030_3911 [Acinetobacter baumannii 45057_4]EYT27362.1 hypothetical protein J497_04023 [Acinetobacter baumannii 1121032]QID24188.1 hypothetical protein [Acinetobacter baumannii]EXR35210.1 hypothetical protein J668_3887 [Acinetobacter baumannii 1276470-86]